MVIANYIRDIRLHLLKVHTQLLGWSEKNDLLKAYRPEDGGWTIDEILEHVALTNHFMMILIDKGCKKSLRKLENGHDLEETLSSFDFDLDRQSIIGEHNSFLWHSSDHTTPIGKLNINEIQDHFMNQIRRCLDILNQLPNGEGVIHRITMSVQGLGKLSVYEYIYFMTQHAARHLSQIKENESEYLQSQLKN